MTEGLEPLYTAAEMQRAEEGHDVPTLMERAGTAVAERVLRDFPAARTITAVCGSGHNGGDGRIAARLLGEAGREVRVVDARDGEEQDLGRPDLILDALFGTGFSGEPRPTAARLIERMNGEGAEIVAVDLPSGVDSSTGEVAGAVVDATATVAFHGEKVGHRVTPAAFHTGSSVHVADIGLQPAETEHVRATRELLRLVPRRGRGDTKYTAGSVLVAGGSHGMTGAAALAARAAFRADAGYVAIAAPAESVPVLETLVVEAVKRPLDDVTAALERAGALALGPGLGRTEEAKALVRQLLADTDLPAVVDADALDGLQPFERDAPTVLTPHSGELARLLGVDSRWVDAHRLQALSRAIQLLGCVVLLKGEGTLIGAPGHGPIVCDGFAGLATAGTGDVLTGITAAFLAKGMDARLAAAAAATAHTWAAIEAGRTAGLVAGDVAEALPRVLARARPR
jgi:NAD(P)H-hydrate epimerase